MYIALLGRQPELSIAELERVFGSVTWLSDQSALIKVDPSETPFDIQTLGGTQKAGRVITTLPHTDWRRVADEIVRHYSAAWAGHDGKLTLGLSTYGFDVSPREVQKVGLRLKAKLKQSGTSLRLIPNPDVALNTAASHHNKLGLSDNKIELLIVRSQAHAPGNTLGSGTVIAESVGAQNITALAARDQGRPRRDAFVGMLPPKLAQIMINLAGIDRPTSPPWRLLDPFCGTGVLLQEAALLGLAVYGSDLSEKMIRYSRDNLNWLKDSHHLTTDWYLHEGDAMDATWQQPIDVVVSETYLGQPFSAPPSPAKLTEVRGTCNHIIGTFLKNLSGQIASGTPVVLAIPAWKASDGQLTHLPLTAKLDQFGYERTPLTTVDSARLLYARPDQVVAREILVLRKK